MGKQLTARRLPIVGMARQYNPHTSKVDRPEAFIPADLRDVPMAPWRSSEVAILPLDRRAAAVLDTAAGWRRVAEARPDSGRADASGLWVRESWWRSATGQPLPAAPVRLRIPDTR